VVEHSTNNPKIEGSNLATGFEKEKNCRNVKNVLATGVWEILPIYLYLFLPCLCKSGTVVEHSTHNPKIKVFNLATRRVKII
jgi:hypothetical protein